MANWISPTSYILSLLHILSSSEYLWAKEDGIVSIGGNSDLVFEEIEPPDFV